MLWGMWWKGLWGGGDGGGGGNLCSRSRSRRSRWMLGNEGTIVSEWRGGGCGGGGGGGGMQLGQRRDVVAVTSGGSGGADAENVLWSEGGTATCSWSSRRLRAGARARTHRQPHDDCECTKVARACQLSTVSDRSCSTSWRCLLLLAIRNPCAQ